MFGAVFGSFLNVCILRWGAEPKQSVVRPPSRCPRCGHSLSWYENVPDVLLARALRGRCRGCGAPISIQYPLIELAVAVIWAGMVWRYGPGLAALAGAVFFTILLGIAITDARAYIIPDEFSLGGLVHRPGARAGRRVERARHRGAGRGGRLRPAVAGGRRRGPGCSSRRRWAAATSR